MGEGESPFRVAGEPRKELPPAPRVVSADLLRVLRYGRAMAQVGWGIATVGAIVLLFVAGSIDFDPPRYDTRVTGVLGEVRCLTDKKGRTTGCSADYGFYDLHHNPRMATSEVDIRADRGDSVTIEYDARNSRWSRVVGFGGDPVPWQAIFVPIGLIAIGLGIAFRARRAAAGDVRLLRYGLPTTGTRVATRDRRISIQGHDLYALMFEYVVAGRTHRVEIMPWSTAALIDDAAEPMVYDPANPDNATTLDHLPGKPRILDDGKLAADAGFIYHLLILPLAVGVLVVAAVAVLVIRGAG